MGENAFLPLKPL